MKNAEEFGADQIVGWPKNHFTGHKRRYREFDAATVKAILALRTTAQRVENSLAAWFLEVGLTPQKFGVLIVLAAEDGPISLSELRRYLSTTQANVTGLVALRFLSHDEKRTFVDLLAKIARGYEVLER